MMSRLNNALVLVAAAASLLVLSARSDDCDGRGGLSRERYHSNLASRPRYYTVYLPPCYAEGSETYPLLMLLHGSNADDSQWPRLGLVENLEETEAAAPMIVVMPFGDAIANENRFEGLSYGSLLLELLDHIEQHYHGDGRIAVGGISRGGFWAYHLGLRYPERFVAIGGHSPFLDVRRVEAAYNPLDLAGSVDADIAPRLWLDRGTRDYAADGVDRMRAVLRDAGIDHRYVVYADSAHDEASWSRHLADYLDFYRSAFEPNAPTIDKPDNPPALCCELWIPAAAFSALRTSVSRAELDAILHGMLNEWLIMRLTDMERLRDHGIDLHPDTPGSAADDLERRLWRDKRSFTLLPFDELNLRLRPLWLDGLPVPLQTEDYPLIFADGQPNYDADKLTRVTLSGTTAIARQTQTAISEMGLEEAIGGIRDYVSGADFFHVTNEATIAPTCPRFTDSVLGGANSLCMTSEHARIFSLLGVDVVDLTGNHINDYGYEAMKESLRFFQDSGLKTVGGGLNVQDARRPLLIERHGGSIAWLACNAIGPYYALANDDPSLLGGERPGAAYCEGEWLREALPILAAQADLVILTVQYQEFGNYIPTAQQRADFRRFAEWGADAVIGTAEHQPMTFEFYETRRGESAFIHYGLGNLFFDQRSWGGRRFFLDTLYVYDGKLLAVELYPGIIDEQARPRALYGEEAYNFLHFMMIQQNGY